jgi:TatD DNase family protein
MEPTGWTDTHAHLADTDLFSHLQSVLAQAAVHGVHRVICVAVDAESLDAIDNIYRQIATEDSNIPSVWSSAGIHPNYAHQEKPGDWEKIVSKTSHPRLCALGETGLDKYWDDCPMEVQLANFQKHWKLSRETGLPVIVHSRECDQEMLDFLDREFRHGPLLGVMHSFCSSYEVACRCIDMGLYISFSGMLTYKKNDALRDVARRLPLERLLVETDAPYLSPEPKRSARPNVPAYVAYTGKILAQLHGKSESQMAQATTENALNLFQRMR